MQLSYLYGVAFTDGWLAEITVQSVLP